MIALRGEMMGTVTVDVKEIESTDLSRVLAEIRSEYETGIERNRREAETWYTKQVQTAPLRRDLLTLTLLCVDILAVLSQVLLFFKKHQQVYG